MVKCQKTKTEKLCLSFVILNEVQGLDGVLDKFCRANRPEFKTLNSRL